jgi:dephospho-CoA kinase
LKIVGLTGGIGSGKTTIAKMFEELGVPLYYADIEAKKLMHSSAILRKKIIALMGADAYSNEDLNRGYIAKIVFNDRKKLEQLNALVHPEVENHFKKWLGLQNAAYVIQENALIFENNKQGHFDSIIAVTAPFEKRIERVMKRDDVTKQQVLDRIDNQIDDDYKVKHATFVINNTILSESKDQVSHIHRRLLN